jgi:hypothetical protein
VFAADVVDGHRDEAERGQLAQRRRHPEVTQAGAVGAFGAELASRLEPLTAGFDVAERVQPGLPVGGQFGSAVGVVWVVKEQAPVGGGLQPELPAS